VPAELATFLGFVVFLALYLLASAVVRGITLAYPDSSVGKALAVLN